MMTILVMFLTLAFASVRYQVLVKYDDTKHQETRQEISLERQVMHQTDSNFNIAIGLYNWYQQEYETIDMEEYVILDAFIETKLESVVETFDLELHDCTYEDRARFHAKAEDSVQKSFEEDFLLMKCFTDPDKIHLKG